ncbi:MAG: hypothetical protein ABI844_18850 [Saprospiraceae bacterium]
MGQDLSEVFYEKYFSGNNRLIVVSLKNGKQITGIFVSIFINPYTGNKPSIRAWQIVEEKYKLTLGIDDLGYLLGEIILQKEIDKVRFLHDNTIMNFD